MRPQGEPWYAIGHMLFRSVLLRVFLLLWSTSAGIAISQKTLTVGEILVPNGGIQRAFDDERERYVIAYRRD
jgi:hypothetical protein